MSKRTGLRLAAAFMATAGMALAGCANSDPLSNGDQDAGADPADSGETVVIGSQDYYSNEIIAEIYAQSLEDAGYDVDRQFRIGQREVYLPEIEAGEIDLLPEYTGNLLQYWRPDTTARKSEDVYAELAAVAPKGLEVLDRADASDQDSYTVTKEFADKWDVSSLDDLAGVDEPMTLGGNSELETRPYGPTGLKDSYEVDVEFTPIEDSGGPLTIKALNDGDIQLANIYTADPAIAEHGLVILSDPQGLFLASNVVPVVRTDLDPGVAAVINKVQHALTPEDLVLLNARSVDEELPASTIAADWLKEKDL